MTRARMNSPTNKRLEWLPIDLPEFSGTGSIVDLFQEEYVPEYAQRFSSQSLTVKKADYAATGWRPDLRATHQDLFDYIDHCLPFQELVSIKIHRSRASGNWHRDFMRPERRPDLFANNAANEPCGYRMVLQGERQGSLELRVQTGGVTEVIRPVMPDTAQWYALGHTCTWHSQVGYLPDRYILFCHGWIDAQRHREIIERSLAKYQDCAVWSQF